MRIGVIGTGSMGRHHARVYSEINGVELVGIADIDRERGSALAREYGTDHYIDYQQLLDKELDGVTIAVPTTLHKEVALEAINRGVNVLVEKPIADSVENAQEMILAAKKAGVKLMVGHIERFNPAIVALKKEIDSGKLGKIVSISATRVGPFEKRIRDVGIILDLSVHDIDLMSYLYGESVREVYSSAGSVIHQFEDYATIFLKFNNGNAGIIKTNWLTPHKMRKLSVTGTQGIAYVDNIAPSLEVYNGAPGIKVRIEKREPLKNELEHFVECIETGCEPIVKGEDGLSAIKVALAAVDSYRQGKAMGVV